VNRSPRLGSSRSFYEMKAALYANACSQVVLRQVLRHLPLDGRVLDIGCGSGHLLGRLSGHAGYRAGVELSTVAAKSANRHADEVVMASIEDELPFAPDSFDVVVCADILEHLADPASGLDTAARLCRPGGVVIISVPNVANWEARLRLLRGVWRYEATGLFDSGHLRFLTQATLLAMVRECGLVIDSCLPEVCPSLTSQSALLARLPRLGRVAVNRTWAVLGDWLARGRPTLFAYQLVCTARRPVYLTS